MPAVEEIILGDAPQEVVLGDAPALMPTGTTQEPQSIYSQASELKTRLPMQFWNQTVANTIHGLAGTHEDAIKSIAGEIQQKRIDRRKQEGIQIQGGLGGISKFNEDEFQDIVGTLKGQNVSEDVATDEGIKRLKQMNIPYPYQPEKAPFGFKIDPAKDIPEYLVDTVAGLGAFITQLAVFRETAPAETPEAAIWEGVNIANGGRPGAGAAMYGLLGMSGQVGAGLAKGIPTKTWLGKTAKAAVETAPQSLAFGAQAKLGGAGNIETAIQALIPVALRVPKLGRELTRPAEPALVVPAKPPVSPAEAITPAEPTVPTPAPEIWQIPKKEYINQTVEFRPVLKVIGGEFDGQILQDPKAAIHAQIEVPKNVENSATTIESGFVDKQGNYFSTDQIGTESTKLRRPIAEEHQKAVAQALSEGKPVPPEVLKDYPRFVKQAPKPPEIPPTMPPEAAKPAKPVDIMLKTADIETQIEEGVKSGRLPKDTLAQAREAGEKADISSQDYLAYLSFLNRLQPAGVGETTPRGMAGGFEPDPVISVKGKGEGGFIGVEGRPTGEIKKPWLDLDKVKSSNPEIETFFGRTERPPYSKKASGLISKIREGLRERFIFAYHLPDVPENALYRDMIRTMPEERRLMGEKAIKDIVKILDNDGSVQALDSAGLDLLRRKVFTQDILREAEIDRSIAGDLKLDQLQAENQRLDMLIEQVPSVKKAFEARQKLWSDTTNDLVKRGVLDEESAKNTAYVRHFVLDLAEKNRPTGFLRKKLSEPYRAYAKERKGSHKDISTDYLSVEVKALRDIYQDNAVEDMANKIGEKADKRKDYSDTARKQNIKLAGQIPEGLTGFSVDKYLRETLGDKYVSPEKLALQDGFVEWHYKRPNIFYRAATMNEAKVAALIENMAEDAGGMIQIPKDQIRSALALGRHKGWLIPEELAKQLDDLPVNKRSNMVVESFTKPFIQFIKRWYLRTNPLRYNTRNALGDTEGLNVAGQTGALKKIPEAVKVLIQKNSPEYDILRKYGGAGSSLWNEMGDFSKLPEFERFRKLTNQKDFVDTVKSIFGTPLRLAGKVGNIEQNLTQFREDILRAAVFLDNYEKLKAGEPVRNWAGNLTNVMEIAKTDIGRAAVKISRETLGDYGNFTPFENNVLRQGLIPFYSWMKINGLRWPSVVKSAAREGVASKVITTGVIKAGLGVASWTVRAMGVYGAVYLWNHRDDKATKKEATLPFWLRAQPHLNIGDMTLWGQTSLSDFAEWYGEEQLSGILWRHEAGLIDSKEAALEAAKIIAQAPVEKIYQAFNPYLKAPIVAISGVETYPQVFKPQYVAPPASNKSLERAMLDIMGGDAKKFYQSISGKRAFDDTLYAYFAGWFGRPADPETMIKEVGQMKAWTTLKMKSQTTGRGKGQAKSGKEPEWQEVKIRERALGVNVPIPPSQKKKTSKKLKQETVGR